MIFSTKVSQKCPKINILSKDNEITVTVNNIINKHIQKKLNLYSTAYDTKCNET